MSDTAPSSPVRHSCRFHCASCDAHFLSLRAFDRHRSGSQDQRVCLDPAEHADRFRVLSAEGVCKIGGHSHEHGVTIWGLEGIDSSRLAALKERASA